MATDRKGLFDRISERRDARRERREQREKEQYDKAYQEAQQKGIITEPAAAAPAAAPANTPADTNVGLGTVVAPANNEVTQTGIVAPWANANNNAPANNAPATQATNTTNAQATTAQQTPYVSNYKELSDALLAKLDDEEKRQAEFEKKRRRNELIQSIGNGIGALSNLWFTTKGAPNAYDPNISDRNHERWERLSKERRQYGNDILDRRIKILENMRRADLDAQTMADRKEMRDIQRETNRRKNEELEVKRNIATSMANYRKSMEEKNYAQAEKDLAQAQRYTDMLPYDEDYRASQTEVNRSRVNLNNAKAGGKKEYRVVHDPVKGDVIVEVDTTYGSGKNNSSSKAHTGSKGKAY